MSTTSPEDFIRLSEEYAAFQARRPDLPQGYFWTLSKHDMKKIIVAFDLERARPMLEAASPKHRKQLERAIRTGILEGDAE